MSFSKSAKVEEGGRRLEKKLILREGVAQKRWVFLKKGEGELVNS